MGTNYRIAQATISRNLTWRGVKELLCYRCGKEIFVGDWIHKNKGFNNPKEKWSRAGKPKGIVRFYHLSCYEEMFLDV